jgi:hypothetical protein
LLGILNAILRIDALQDQDDFQLSKHIQNERAEHFRFARFSYRKRLRAERLSLPLFLFSLV